MGDKISDEMAHAIAQFKNHYAGKTLRDWYQSVESVVGDNRKEEPANFFPEFVYESEYSDRVGGSFPRIEPEELPDFVQQLFGENADWIVAYIQRGTLPDAADKQAVLKALDTLMVGMYDFTPGENILNAPYFIPFVRDAQLLDGELSALMKKSELIKKHAEEMQTFGPEFALLAGTLITSQADIDGKTDYGTPIRYIEREYDKFISPAAKKQIEDTKLFANFSPVEQMNASCGPYAPPPLLPNISTAQLVSLEK